MSNRWTAAALHDELALYYQSFRGLPAPKNSFTEDLWLKILQAESEEAARRGSKKA